ncbi:GDSL-type esterase/lipase family protein [Butyrivibrio sp. MC2021]|uniref:GDSL-type esterase/lipase family protein n=1 Tax=Butyrivibrio sp. MC2021 TaxID=1408306 RepID=UPI000688234C|nr:GDSL-type esterase/lipase family protein [Butyrivibrio sp. MC2021]
MKFLKTCPMLLGVVVCTIFITVMAILFSDTVYADYRESYDPATAPYFVLALKGATEGVFPWNYEPEMYELSSEIAGASDNWNGIDSEISAPAEADGEEPVLIEEPQEDPVDISANDISANDVPEEEEKVYELTEVEPEYFDDALFIGDSRTVGLSEYCQELDEHATFYAKVSLSIFTVLKKQFIKTPEGEIGVEEALSREQFGKIYIMLGLNEIGTGTDEYFTEAYQAVIDRIRELQPDAIIYIQCIMHVTERKSSVDKNFNNVNIDRRNEALSQLADNQTIFYIDMNEAVDDGNGNMEGSLSFDDVHLKASSYQLWYDYLLKHAIVKD